MIWVNRPDKRHTTAWRWSSENLAPTLTIRDGKRPRGRVAAGHKSDSIDFWTPLTREKRRRTQTGPETPPDRRA